MADDSNKTKEEKAAERQEALSKIGKGLGFVQQLTDIGSQMSANRAWKDVAGSSLTDGKTGDTFTVAAKNQTKQDNTFNLASFDEMDTSKMKGIGPVKDAAIYGEHLKKRNKKKKSSAYSDESIA